MPLRRRRRQLEAESDIEKELEDHAAAEEAVAVAAAGASANGRQATPGLDISVTQLHNHSSHLEAARHSLERLMHSFDRSGWAR